MDHVAVNVTGSLMAGAGPIKDHAQWRQERRLVELFVMKLPRDWHGKEGYTLRPGEVVHAFELPSGGRLGENLARLLATYERYYPRAMNCQFTLIVVRNSGGGGNEVAFQGSGRQLGKNLRFWTRADWENSQPFSLAFLEEELQLQVKLDVAWRAVGLHLPHDTVTP